MELKYIRRRARRTPLIYRDVPSQQFPQARLFPASFPTVIQSYRLSARNTGGSLVIDGRSPLKPEPPEFRIAVNLVCFTDAVGHNRVFCVDPFENASVDINHVGISLSLQLFCNPFTPIPH
jgi:hypothetical protein